MVTCTMNNPPELEMSVVYQQLSSDCKTTKHFSELRGILIVFYFCPKPASFCFRELDIFSFSQSKRRGTVYRDVSAHYFEQNELNQVNPYTTGL